MPYLKINNNLFKSAPYTNNCGKMGGVDADLIEIKGMPDKELQEFLRKNAVSLSIFEARRVAELIGRNPTITELYIFNTQWSEHSSYKSSRAVLKALLLTQAPNVILGPVEDSGIVELGYIGNERYGIVVSHERSEERR